MSNSARLPRIKSAQGIDFSVLHNTGKTVLKVEPAELLSQSEQTTSFENLLLDNSQQSSELQVNDKLYVDCTSPNQIISSSSGADQITNQSPTLVISNLLSQFHFKDSLERKNTMTEVAKELEANFASVLEDIEDHIDENLVDESLVVVEDIDVCVHKIEQLRTTCRNINKGMIKHFSSDKYEESFGKTYSVTMSKIKDYILSAKQRKSQIRHDQVHTEAEERTVKQKKENENLSQKKRASEFLITEILRLIAELRDEFRKDKVDVSDEEIFRRKDDLSSNLIKLDRLSNKFQHALEIIPDEYEEKDSVIMKMKSEYDKLLQEKQAYEEHLQGEIQERELMKERSFQTACLNIKLLKFKGYDSDLDIYSFQAEFEKLYQKSTPKKMLPDLLKNNYLSDPALALVKSLDDIENIWIRLKKAYGDPKVMLKKKFADVKKIGPLWRLKDSERIKEGLVSVINLISDLMKLAEKHHIEAKLYNGDGIDMIYGLMGDSMITRWLTSISDETLEDEELWVRLVKFLEKELKVQQEKSLINRKVDDPVKDHGFKSDDKKNTNLKKYGTHHTSQDGKETKHCHFCNELGHVQTSGPRGSSLIQYFVCKKFVEMNPSQRFRELRSKGLCFQCLYPGAHQKDGKHSDGTCQRDFTCKNSSHDKYPCKKHILVCHEHRDTDENKQILEDYKSRCILRQKTVPEFSKDIKLSFIAYQAHTSKKINKCTQLKDDDDIVLDNAIYMLQTINVDNERYTLFFDSGCSDMVSRYSAVQRIRGRASHELKGLIKLGGVGDVQTESAYGVYQVRLPLVSGKNAVLTGVCLEQITATFPIYPLQGKVQCDIEEAYKLSGGDTSDLPSLPKCIGGDVDFMIGAKYLRYHPKEIFTLPSGLSIYSSPFANADGGQGVIGGPHAIFTEINKSMSSDQLCQHAYFSEQYKLYKIGFQVNPDNHLLHMKYTKDFKHQLMAAFEYDDPSNSSLCNCIKDEAIDTIDDYAYCSCLLTVRRQKYFEEAENAASEIMYRCIDCRKCSKCRNGERIELISVREEVEQDLINKSVKVDVQAGVTTAKLPLLDNPVVKLAPNKNKAIAVYNGQIKKLNKNKHDKLDVIKSEAKLQDLGHVEFVRNLSSDQQKRLKDNPVQNYIPWRCVWNGNSVTTPCRLVFDASQPTDTSYSLNSILAKGRNNMNKLVEILIRWMSHKIAFHTDIQKMYNSVQLLEEDWCLQRYIWQQDLDPSKIPEEKVIKTLIYGVRSSGNQAEYGIRETANIFKEDYPEVNLIVQKDTYVDDCMSGEQSVDLAYQRADELTLVLRKGGFGLKGFTFSGEPPLPSLSENGKCINVAGMKWNSEDDELQLDIGELNFSKKQRGKKNVTETSNEIPVHLTRRHCVGKVSEIFDITGKVTPITASMKLDLHTLVERKLDWDDKVPDDLRPIWLSHFEMITELGSIKFKRAIVPDDAIDLEIDTIDTGDSSKLIACIAIYARFKRRSGEYSCQLVFARSKLVPDGMTQPRAELLAAHVNAHTGEVVKRAFGTYHKSSLKLTDSQITLHWINNKDLSLKQWVRNRVVEITRFTDTSSWKYVKSADMIADLGTRRGAKIEDVSLGSQWQDGFVWMKLDTSKFPVMSYDEIKLNSTEIADIKKEMVLYNDNLTAIGWLQESFCCRPSNSAHSMYHIPPEVLSRYEFSEYLLDPNKFRFTKCVRIIALAQRFVKKLKSRFFKRNGVSSAEEEAHPDASTSSDTLSLKDEELQEAFNYYYRKASMEVKEFTNKEQYGKISLENNDILYYNGRILPDQQFTVVTTMTNVMKDLTSSSFCVPIIDHHSPLAYSVINEIHWHSEVARHSGVETTLRYTMKYGYILGGRELVKMIRKNCERCRFLAKRTIDVSMGPVSKHNLTIAPAFYITQVDLAGPFKAYTPHNKRVTIKVWFTVFCCATTSTISIKVMEDYSASAFIQSFIRFSCEVGYPKLLLIDEGSQLIKGCESMRLNYQDVKTRLHLDSHVEFDTCPVGGHNMHGKVERKIKQIKESVEKSMHNERLSIMEWETLCSEIGNSINDLPIALNNIVADIENMDLITPNRLRLGRNNDRSPVGALLVSASPDKFLNINMQIFNVWFENWLISHVPKLMNRPKWFRDDYDLSEGDIVLFLKQEGSLASSYQYGMVKSLKRSSDGKIRSVQVKYRNHNEGVDRVTDRAVRKLVVIHRVDELNLTFELGRIATLADMKRKLELEQKH